MRMDEITQNVCRVKKGKDSYIYLKGRPTLKETKKKQPKK